MDKNVILVFGIFGIFLLIFGCIGQGQQVTSTEQAGATSGAQKPSAPPTTSDLTGKSWSELVALNKPIECDMTVKEEGEQPLTVKIYLKGNDFKEEFSSEGVPTYIIVKSGEIYMNNPLEKDEREAGLENCDWLKSDKEYQKMYGELGLLGQSQDLQDVKMLEELGKATFVCKYSEFGADVFNTPGDVCSLSDLLKTIPGGLG